MALQWKLLKFTIKSYFQVGKNGSMSIRIHGRGQTRWNLAKPFKKMINQVVWIWQYQEPETNKYRKSRRQKWNQNNLGILAQPKTHPPVSNGAFYLSVILVKHLLSQYFWHLLCVYSLCHPRIKSDHPSMYYLLKMNHSQPKERGIMR